MKRKRVMQSVEREKTWAEKIELAYCRCTHANTVHTGALWTCGFIGCTCQEFRERITSDEPRSAFQTAKAGMGK